MPVFLIHLLVFFVPPVLVLGWLLRASLRRYKRTLLWSLVFVCTMGAVWDWLSVRTGVWRYDSAPTLGLWVAGLPVEEFVGFYLVGTLFMALVILFVLEKTNRVR
jgi:lycopene cyclase domain-containing protein